MGKVGGRDGHGENEHWRLRVVAGGLAWGTPLSTFFISAIFFGKQLGSLSTLDIETPAL